jgi:hypothetical protein
MSWETIRRRRLPLHPLRGTWQVVALAHPEESDPAATFVLPRSARTGDTPGPEGAGQGVVWIELDALKFSALNGLHRVSLVNTDEQGVEIDFWTACLDITEQGQMVSFPAWTLEQFFEHNGQRPLEAVTPLDERQLLLTAWHGWDRVTPRQFRLTKTSGEL